MKYFLLIFLIVTNVFAQESIYPVVWTKNIKLKSLQDIPEILKEKISEVTYVNDKNESKIATTCHDYFKLTEQGFYPQNNAEIAKESFFKEKCDSLKRLMSLQPAKQSYLRNFNLSKSYGQLPAALIFPSLSSEKKINGDVKTLYPDIVVELNKDKDTIDLISKRAGMKTHVAILAWGDSNQDGYDDVLLFIAHYALKGTYHAYSNAVITKKSEKGKIISLAHC